MLLRVDSTSAADIATITADGEVDLATVNTLRSALTEAMQQGATHVTLDLDKVTYIDSSGLGTLIGAHKRLAAAGGTLRVRCSQARTLRLFSITGLDRVLTVTTDDEEYDAADLSRAMPA
jgi:anti-sigma B factor antagonist